MHIEDPVLFFSKRFGRAVRLPASVPEEEIGKTGNFDADSVREKAAAESRFN